VLQDDAAPAFAKPAGDEAERRLDALRLLFGDGGELLDGERLRGDHEQRLDRAGEPVDRVL
jgi:hypothetical protein